MLRRPASAPKPFGHGTFPIDSLNLWPWLSAAGPSANMTAPREELVLGKMGGEAMVTAEGWKIIVGAQSPDWWYIAPHPIPCACGHTLHLCTGAVFRCSCTPDHHTLSDSRKNG